MLVPQEGFLFDDTIAANVRYGKLDATEDEIRASAVELGIDDWLRGLPRGLHTQVGQRGESLSAGERQLVALLRAHLADPDLLVLDEATSAVDPALEMQIGRALERLMQSRTSVTIAHRLSTAESADEVIVVDKGRVVQRGPHRRARHAGRQRLRRPPRELGRPALAGVAPARPRRAQEASSWLMSMSTSKTSDSVPGATTATVRRDEVDDVRGRGPAARGGRRGS